MDDKEYKKIFYEKMYAGKKSPDSLSTRNVIDVLYTRFKKFEVHREDAVGWLVSPGGRLLDIGCGNGSFIFKVADKFREVHGVDISPGRIAEASMLKKTMHNQANIHFQAADSDSRLPYEDEYFDTITSIATLEHVFDPYHAVAEMKRVLKNGGEIILEVPNIAWLPRRISFFLGNLPKTSHESGWDGGHLHYFTVGALKDFLQTQGFAVLKVSGSGVFSRVRKCWVSLLSGDIIIRAKKMPK